MTGIVTSSPTGAHAPEDRRRRRPRERLTAEDEQILRLEAGNVRGHTCTVILLEPSGDRPLPTLDALRGHVAARLDAAPRLRQRLMPTPLGIARPVWVDDPEFDIVRHVGAAETAEPADHGGVRAAVAHLMEQPLDRRHPLWRLDMLECPDGGLALVWRVHHCMADGSTVVRLGEAVLWQTSAGEADPPPSSWQPERLPGRASLLREGLADRARDGRSRLATLLGDARAARRRESARSARALHDAVARELAGAADPTPLDRPAGPARTIAFARAPLAGCRDAAKAVDEAATINDAVLAIVAGGVHDWLEHRHGREAGIRVKVPVSLHDKSVDVANRDSCFFVDLPVAEPDPVSRLRAIQRETSACKRSNDAEALDALMRHRSVVRRAMSPHVFTLNVSNVPGPRDDVHVAGCPVRELYSLAEIAPHHALRVSVISAAGHLHFGLCADRDAVGDLDVLAKGVERSIDELLTRAPQ